MKSAAIVIYNARRQVWSPITDIVRKDILSNYVDDIWVDPIDNIGPLTMSACIVEIIALSKEKMK